METEKKLRSFEKARNSMYKNLEAVEIVFWGLCQFESHSWDLAPVVQKMDNYLSAR